MAPVRNRARGVQNDQDQTVAGLPIRNWRRIEGNIGAPSEEQPIAQQTRWPELPMPRDSHLLSEMSRHLLRIARLPRASKPAESSELDTERSGEEEERKTSTDPKGFQIRKWSQMAKDWNPPDRHYLAKRRKGLPPPEGSNSLYGPAGQGRAFRTLRVKRIDADGIAHVYQVMAPVGVAVPGELPETDGGLSGPLEPRQPPGTVIDGIGIANEDGIIVAQPTPVRRRGPPPPRKKKRFFGRNKKRIETEYGPDGLPVHPPGPSDLITRTDGDQEDTQMPDANDNDDEEDEGSGEEHEEGEEGEGEGEGDEGDEDDDREDDHDDDRDGDDHDEDENDDSLIREMSASATPLPPAIYEDTKAEDARSLAENGVSLPPAGPGPSSLRTELPAGIDAPVQRQTNKQTDADVHGDGDVAMDEAPKVEAIETDLSQTQIALPATLEPEPVVEPVVPEITPDIPAQMPEATIQDTEMLAVPADDAASAPPIELPPILQEPIPEPATDMPLEPAMRPVDETAGPASAAIVVPDPSSTSVDNETTILPPISEVVPVTLTEQATSESQVGVVAPVTPMELVDAGDPPSAPILQHVEPVFIPTAQPIEAASTDAQEEAQPVSAEDNNAPAAPAPAPETDAPELREAVFLAPEPSADAQPVAADEPELPPAPLQIVAPAPAAPASPPEPASMTASVDPATATTLPNLEPDATELSAADAPTAEQSAVAPSEPTVAASADATQDTVSVVATEDAAPAAEEGPAATEAA